METGEVFADTCQQRWNMTYLASLRILTYPDVILFCSINCKRKARMAILNQPFYIHMRFCIADDNGVVVKAQMGAQKVMLDSSLSFCYCKG